MQWTICTTYVFSVSDLDHAIAGLAWFEQRGTIIVPFKFIFRGILVDFKFFEYKNLICPS